MFIPPFLGYLHPDPLPAGEGIINENIILWLQYSHRQSGMTGQGATLFMKPPWESRIFYAVMWLSIWLGAGCTPRPEKPNVILLTLDTLRADALGCYGNPVVQTPHLDRIAREGVLFEDAICQIPATLTSHTAILTGRNPKTTGVRFRTALVPSEEETLPERFQTYGYDTAAFISSSVLDPAFGLNQGFGLYDMGSIGKGETPVTNERRAEETISSAIDYLNKKEKRPFFIWIHLYDPHTPYEAPPPYTTMYDPDYTGPLRGSVAEITFLNATRGAHLSERDLQHLQALYHGEVTYMDHQIGRLLEALEKKDLLGRTILVALADHGEALGEKGRFFHGDDLYQPAIHIPFLMRYPPAFPPGQRVAEMVQSIDLFPTLTELCGIPLIAGIEGKSLLPLISSPKKNPGGYDKHPGFLETEADVVAASNKLYGLRSDEYKFIYHSARRRPETPLGLFTEIPLKGPAIVLARVKGDPSVRLMAHIRYRTPELYTSRDLQALSRLNTTAVYAETFGTDPLHNQAKRQSSFLPTPEGWRLQATPDLYHTARTYGLARGWPTEWMVLEGVGVDASLPAQQKTGTFVIDQVELYSPSLRYPPSPRFRNPFWVIEDFEDLSSTGLVDAGAGPAHRIDIQWRSEGVFGGQRQPQITITFLEDQDPLFLNELYQPVKDPREERNLLPETLESSPNQVWLETARRHQEILDGWIAKESGLQEIQELSPAQRQALEALGYTK